MVHESTETDVEEYHVPRDVTWGTDCNHWPGPIMGLNYFFRGTNETGAAAEKKVVSVDEGLAKQWANLIWGYSSSAAQEPKS